MMPPPLTLARASCSNLSQPPPNTLVMAGDRLADVSLSGDFFFYPAEKLAELEEALVGARLGEVEQAVEDFYRRWEIESPGVSPGDFTKVLGGG